MPICIECSYPVPQLYQRLSSKKAPPVQKDEPFRGGGEAKKASSNTSADVRLMQCPRCKRFADKYVEHDFVVLFIDLVLVKPQVYRHLLFNNDRLIAPASSQFTPAIKRLGTLLVLFDVYLTWSSVEKLPSEVTGGSAIPKLPILTQYLFYLVLCAVTTSAQHLVIRELAQLEWFRGTNGGNKVASSGSTEASSQPSSKPHSTTSIAQASISATTSKGYSPASNADHAGVSLLPPRRNAVSTALFVSSCTKLFPILMVVWKYEDKTGQLASGVNWAVAIQNVEALRILLGSGYGSSALLVAIGWMTCWLVSQVILAAFGLRNTDWSLSI